MIIEGEQMVSLHTGPGGVTLYQYLPHQLQSLTWTRTLRDTSQLDLTIPADLGPDPDLDVVPFQHWLSVWTPKAARPLWTGPIIKPDFGRDTVKFTARDISVFTGYTRVSTTKSWRFTDPSVIAAELWDGLLNNHGLAVTPTQNADPLGTPFDYDVTADVGLVKAAMDDLVERGLYWTVVGDTPVLGRAPLAPVASLSEDHFIGGDPRIVRDGTRMANDILVRGADNLARYRVDRAGLNLQTVINIDDMFGVSNVAQAAGQYARYMSAPRDAIVMGAGTQLHPDAPVTIDQLVPSARVITEILGRRSTMELEGVEVTSDGLTASVGVTLESVTDYPPELAQFTDGGKTASA